MISIYHTLDDGTEVLLHCEGDHTKADPGRYQGPAELCYPAEAERFEIYRTYYTDDDGQEVPVPFTADGWLELEDRIIETILEVAA